MSAMLGIISYLEANEFVNFGKTDVLVCDGHHRNVCIKDDGRCCQDIHFLSILKVSGEGEKRYRGYCY